MKAGADVVRALQAPDGQSNPTDGHGQCKHALKIDAYPRGFEDDDSLRSDFIRDLTLEQLDRTATLSGTEQAQVETVPRTLVRYWHDPQDVPDDVRACLDSWNQLRDEGFEFRMFRLSWSRSG